MAGTSRLLVIVEVAFGAGALDTGTLTWTDISSHVKLARGIECSRGVDTETGGPMPGRLTFAVNNDAGDFTPGKTGAFGLIRNRLPVRLRTVVGSGTGIPLAYDSPFAFDFDTGYDDVEVGSVVVWTGLVETWKIGWTAGVRSQVDVTCVDRWAALRRLKFKPDLYSDLPTIRTAACYWKLDDAAGTTRAAATNGPSDLIIGNGAAVSFGALRNLSDISAVSLGDAVGTYGVLAPATSLAIGSAAGISLSFWLRTTDNQTISGSDRWVSFSGTSGSASWSLYMQMNTTQTTASWVLSTSGGMISGASPATIAGGKWVHLAVTVGVSAGTGTITAYANGVAGTPGVGAVALGPFTTGYIQGPGGSTRPPYAYSQFAGWDAALAASDVLLQYQAGNTATWPGQTAGVRAALIANFQASPVTVTTTGTFTATMSKQDLADKPLADALAECATAEAGQLFIGTDGWPTLTSRAWRTAAALAFTIPAHALSTDTSWTLDDQQLVNSATVDRMVGDQTAATVTARNDDSVETYGEQTTSVSLYVDSDAQLLERANAEANMFATATPRSSDLTVDLITKAATISPATLLAADVGSRIAVSGMPTEAPTQTQFYVAAIADKITHTGWERTFTVSPRLDWWTLQDATSGQLDSTFVLAF